MVMCTWPAIVVLLYVCYSEGKHADIHHMNGIERYKDAPSDDDSCDDDSCDDNSRDGVSECHSLLQRARQGRVW